MKRTRLSGLTDDLTNAAGSLTGQQGRVLSQFYDTNVAAITRNGAHLTILQAADQPERLVAYQPRASAAPPWVSVHRTARSEGAGDQTGAPPERLTGRAPFPRVALAALAGPGLVPASLSD